MWLLISGCNSTFRGICMSHWIPQRKTTDSGYQSLLLLNKMYKINVVAFSLHRVSHLTSRHRNCHPLISICFNENSIVFHTCDSGRGGALRLFVPISNLSIRRAIDPLSGWLSAATRWVPEAGGCGQTLDAVSEQSMMENREANIAELSGVIVFLWFSATNCAWLLTFYGF